MEEFLEVDWWTSIADHNASNTSDVAPTTSFITLFLIPLVIPLLAVNCQKVWYKAMGKNDENISPFDYGRYYKNGGLYGSLGFLSPTVSSALIGAACFTLLTLVFLT